MVTNTNGNYTVSLPSAVTISGVNENMLNLIQTSSDPNSRTSILFRQSVNNIQWELGKRGINDSSNFNQFYLYYNGDASLTNNSTAGFLMQWYPDKSTVLYGTMFPYADNVANLGTTQNKWQNLYCNQINGVPVNLNIGSTELKIQPTGYNSNLQPSYYQGDTHYWVSSNSLTGQLQPVDWTAIYTALGGSAGATFTQITSTGSNGITHTTQTPPITPGGTTFSNMWGVEITATGLYEMALNVSAFTDAPTTNRLYTISGVTRTSTGSYSNGTPHTTLTGIYQQVGDMNTTRFVAKRYIDYVPYFCYIQEQVLQGYGIRFYDLSFTVTSLSKLNA